ncbi:MAG TPA: aldolase/citrate lyase family protein, partial [Noviherbaspirillum sp.]|nr:aldolase/citrate lyase family protein [Noviherbaspirillum sp.]
MHPSAVLFQGKHKPVTIPACDHYAGSEKLMHKSIALQQELGPVFDITLDCEDGASAGNEEAHAKLIASLVTSDTNRFNRIGARIHDVTHPCFERDIELICAVAARRLAYLVVPKADSLADVECAVDIIQRHAVKNGRDDLPVHVLIETHGALAAAHSIAALSQVECLSFGIMDFVSAHYGAIPGNAMRSPGQFTHPLVVRAKL